MFRDVQHMVRGREPSTVVNRLPVGTRRDTIQCCPWICKLPWNNWTSVDNCVWSRFFLFGWVLHQSCEWRILPKMISRLPSFLVLPSPYKYHLSMFSFLRLSHYHSLPTLMWSTPCSCWSPRIWYQPFGSMTLPCHRLGEVSLNPPRLMNGW